MTTNAHTNTTRPLTNRWLLATVAGLALGLTSAAALADDAKKAPDPKAEYEQRMAYFDTLDKDKSGALAGEELPKKWDVLFDADNDGKVEKKEFSKLMKRPAKLRYLHPLRDPIARARQSMRLDRDKDGFVQMQEYPGGDNVFKKADRNRDSKLDLGELLVMAKRELEDIGRKMKRAGRYDFLAIFDIDRNRSVTADEYDGSAKLFRKFDTNGDGTVSYAELYPERMEAQREAMEAAKPVPEDVSVVQAMDANEDGRVSRAEWKGTSAGWRRLDRNRDGWISSADAH